MGFTIKEDLEIYPVLINFGNLKILQIRCYISASYLKVKYKLINKVSLPGFYLKRQNKKLTSNKLLKTSI